MPCAKTFCESGRNVGDWIPAASRLGKAISNALVLDCMDADVLRNITKNVALISSLATNVREKCMREFDARMNEEVRT